MAASRDPSLAADISAVTQLAWDRGETRRTLTMLLFLQVPARLHLSNAEVNSLDLRNLVWFDFA